jgi:hypothetical protein
LVKVGKAASVRNYRAAIFFGFLFNFYATKTFSNSWLAKRGYAFFLADTLLCGFAMVVASSRGQG